MLEEILGSKVEKLQKRMERPQAPRPVVAGAGCMRFLRYRFLRPFVLAVSGVFIFASGRFIAKTRNWLKRKKTVFASR